MASWMWLICSVQHMASVSQGFPMGWVSHRDKREQQKERRSRIVFLTAAVLSFFSLTLATVLVLTAVQGGAKQGVATPSYSSQTLCTVQGHSGCCSIVFG